MAPIRIALAIDLYHQGRTVETFEADTCMTPGALLMGSSTASASCRSGSRPQIQGRRHTGRSHPHRSDQCPCPWSGRKPRPRPARIIIALLLLRPRFVQHKPPATATRLGRIAELDIPRTQQMLHVRLDAMFGEWEEDLMQEAVALRSGLDEPTLLRRWKALIHPHWHLLSVRLADKFGNETGLYRRDSSLVVVRTARNSAGSVPMGFTLKDAGIDSIGRPMPAFGAMIRASASGSARRWRTAATCPCGVSANSATALGAWCR
ncbi:MAG: hypothetical protein IPJ85_14495 [Flavobacteriales bacterium]|nr:hypothetical protein [Flavobacteriales bacterium]